MFCFLKKFMRHRKTPETALFYGGKRVKKLEEYFYPILMEEEERDWEQLKKYLAENEISLYCSYDTYDRFLNNVLMTGNSPLFLKDIQSFIKAYPAEVYHLLPSLEITTAKIVSKEEAVS